MFAAPANQARPPVSGCPCYERAHSLWLYLLPPLLSQPAKRFRLVVHHQRALLNKLRSEVKTRDENQQETTCLDMSHDRATVAKDLKEKSVVNTDALPRPILHVTQKTKKLQSIAFNTLYLSIKCWDLARHSKTPRHSIHTKTACRNFQPKLPRIIKTFQEHARLCFSISLPQRDTSQRRNLVLLMRCHSFKWEAVNAL